MSVVSDRVVTRAASDSQAYQTFFDVRSDGELVKRVEEQLESWLRQQKGWDPPTEESGYHIDPDGGRELLVLHRFSHDGRDFRARLTERSPLGRWTTNLTVHDSRIDRSWIGLHVANDQGRFVRVPRLASYLMDALEVRDGEVWMSSAPRRIHTFDVEEFAEDLSCPDRQGLYIVAGANGGDLADHVGPVATRTQQTIGLAQVAILDADATEAFNEIMGPHHRIPPGTIRTYRPEVDPAISSDGRRHRILGVGRLNAEPVAAIQAMLGRAARRHAAEMPRPQRFAAVDQALTRLEDRLLLDALTPETGVSDAGPRVEPEPVARTGGTTVGDDAATYLAQIELVKTVLGLAEVSAERLDDVARSVSRARASTDALDRITQQMEARRQRIEELEEAVRFYQELDDEHELDLAAAEDELSKAVDENRWLRTRLRDLQDYDTAAAGLPETQATDHPLDFAELADRIAGRGLPGVAFTGEVKQVRELEDHDQLGRIARTTWDALLALADYVRARNEGLCDSGVKQYLADTPAGYRTVPPKKFAEKETGATMKAWGDQRAFPVPTDVDPTGFSVMEAHFKLGRVGMVSPRLYYLDDWTRSGKVYVGYIGGHLRNTHTN